MGFVGVGQCLVLLLSVLFMIRLCTRSVIFAGRAFSSGGGVFNLRRFGSEGSSKIVSSKYCVCAGGG